MATYRKTDLGSLKLIQNRVSSKRNRRQQKIERLKSRIADIRRKEETETLSTCDEQSLVRLDFELKQAEADVEQLKEELLAISEKIKQSKTPNEAEEMTGTLMQEPVDEYLQLLGLDAEIVDTQEVEVTNL